MSDKLIKHITYFMRNPHSGFSINKVFTPLFELNKQNSEIIYAPYYKANLLSIFKNIIFVWKNRNKHGINHMTGGPHYFMLGLIGCKSVLTVHDFVLLERKQSRISKFIFYLLWFKIPFYFADRITFISETVKNEALNRFKLNQSKICTIYNPVSSSYKRIPKAFNSKKPRILHIGTAWNKNTERVIKALYGINCTLVLIGKLNTKDLNLLAEYKIDYINKWNLSDDEIYQEYTLCDIVSFPSVYEGFGMPIIEGQATGRVVLTSNIDPMKEIANNSALLVNPYSTESIRNGFLELINNEEYRNKLIKLGDKNIKRFSAEKINEEYMNLYYSI